MAETTICGNLQLPSLLSDTKFESQSGNAVKLGHSAIAISCKVVADRYSTGAKPPTVVIDGSSVFEGSSRILIDCLPFQLDQVFHNY